MSNVRNLHADNRTANRAGAAAFFDVTVVTIDAWVRRGMPYVTRGGRGKEWAFDLRDCAEWKYGAPREVDYDPESLPPKDRLDFYKGSRERDKYLEEAGQLIPAEVHERELAAVFKELALGLESLADVLERDAGLTPLAVERTQAVTDRFREMLFQRITELTITENES